MTQVDSLRRRTSPSSCGWLRRWRRDPYVKLSRLRSYRSRSAFKLVQLDDRYRFLRPGLRVIELGAAPGGWSQVVLERTGGDVKLVAVDKVSMSPLPGLKILTADVLADGAAGRLQLALGQAGADLILSDLAASSSGQAVVDQARNAELAKGMLRCAREILAPGGTLVCKAFHGCDNEELCAQLRQNFRALCRAKPAASRARCSEFYLVAREFVATRSASIAVPG